MDVARSTYHSAIPGRGRAMYMNVIVRDSAAMQQSSDDRSVISTEDLQEQIHFERHQGAHVNPAGDEPLESECQLARIILADRYQDSEQPGDIPLAAHVQTRLPTVGGQGTASVRIARPGRG